LFSERGRVVSDPLQPGNIAELHGELIEVFDDLLHGLVGRSIGISVAVALSVLVSCAKHSSQRRRTRILVIFFAQVNPTSPFALIADSVG
jgi:hypothetical protein